jgi:hypothetical protein
MISAGTSVAVAIATLVKTMKKKRGTLPGRYVPPHIRKWPNRPREYVNVSEYQEKIEPIPVEVEILPQQAELDLTSPLGREENPNEEPC